MPGMKRYDSQILKNARLVKGWTQSRLAEECALNAIDIWRVENDKFHSPRTVAKIAKALNVDMADLILGSDELTFRH